MSEVAKFPFTQTVSEADIDWIVCIELNSSQDFRKWMQERIFPGAAQLQHIRAWRSVAEDNGESDLVWYAQHARGTKVLALVENKIRAPAQPFQYERYVDRCKAYVKD